ncbi:Ca2+-transporting ATPase [Sporothrix brasiliensis 5110]|uniref:Calcium-transporting ATPase n=1 Tax=Sporothrix brasiliensis 5110 TaxID=1398154 RepID=A0A0C2IJC9_9PEZI|nr:Ca2+-transporting ATPase [Sporothrix brasiliensis 5110]KIH89256.1 Ca2+-transporting ATPase [Sporothrix brasiliensis 5110]
MSEDGIPLYTNSPISVSDDAAHSPAATEPPSLSTNNNSLAPQHPPLGPGASTSRRGNSTSSNASTSGSRPQLQTTTSFESRDSRPTSSHNVSSPVMSRSGDRTHGFLAVPHSHRSRQNSVDSEDGSRSVAISQGETVIGSAASGVQHVTRSTSVDGSNDMIMNDPDALKPDRGTEATFHVDNNPFAFSPGQLSKMFDPKSLSAFYSLGGLAGLEKGLRTDRKAGLSVEETSLDGAISFDSAVAAKDHGKAVSGHGSAVVGSQGQSASAAAGGRHDRKDEGFFDRKRVFKDNRLPEKKAKSLLQLIWITFNDKILIMLSIAAVVSLAVGLYQTFGQDHNAEHPAVEWIEGVAIIVAILIVVIVGSLNDWQKERQFAKLNRKKTDRLVKVVRSGRLQEISIWEILVGDVVHLETGDMIPVDGVLIEGHSIKCDESQATGESDLIRKRPADEVYAAIESHEDLKKMDPFIQSGARVMEGLGTFMVTATGVNSTYGKTMMSLQDDPEITPLQAKLNVIADYIAKLGGAAALLLFVVLFIEFLVRLPKLPPYVTPAQKGQDFLNIFIVVVTIIVVAVPEGLPLAVTLALSYATAKMVKENNLVRQLKACEVMGNATTICSDKTGTLTQNRMRVVAGTVGTGQRFGEQGLADVDGVGSPSSSGGDNNKAKDTTVASNSAAENRELTAQEAISGLGKDVRDILLKSITINSTAFEGEVHGKPEYIGSKTESALLSFARDHLAMGPVSEERANAPKTLQLIPFDSGRKCSGVVVELPNGRGARLFVKGASEILLSQCTQILRDPTRDVALSPMTDENRDSLSSLIENYASHSLRCISLVYRDFHQWPPAYARRNEGANDDVVFEDVFKNMGFISLVGIKDPLRDGVRDAVADCQRAGVVVRMVTGDNRLTAQAIARDCGILQDDSEVMEGPVFRNMTKEEQLEIIPRLHVLARSSPEDKRVLVQRLKEQNETVAVTGDGTNDAPALKLADVGFSMGISGTEVAKEASAIILMDDNFASIVKALKWGRAVNDAVKRFLQFQLTVNVTAVVLTFVSAVSSTDESSVLTAVQLLWVNLIMDTLAALALATDPPQPSVLDRLPERKGASIISTTMWKMIIGQALYQLAITFLLFFGGQKVLPQREHATVDQVQTLVFNTFVWMQIFNQWNNRRLDNKFNIFEGLTQNWFFIGISIIMVGGQVLIVQVGGLAFNIASEGQSPTMWGYAVGFGFISIPIGALIRLIPDAWFEKLVPAFVKRWFANRKKKNEQVPDVTVSDPYTHDERFDFYPVALADVRDELAWLKRLKGGRLNNLKFAIQHPRETFALPASLSPSHSRSNSRSNSHSLPNSRSNSFNMSTGPRPHTPTREDSFGSTNGPGLAGGLGATLMTPSASPDSRRRSRSMRSMRSRSNSALGAPTVMAGIIAGSVAVGWSPIDRSNSSSSLYGQHTNNNSDNSDNSNNSNNNNNNNNNGAGNSTTSNVDFGSSYTGRAASPSPAPNGSSQTPTRESSTARLLRDNTDGTDGTHSTSLTAVTNNTNDTTETAVERGRSDSAPKKD